MPLQITIWEFRSSTLFGCAILREYGGGSTFVSRKAILQAKAETYFVARPSQDHQGDFCRLCTECEGFAARRHDVAHAVVRLAIIGVDNSPSLQQYVFLPSFYDPRRFSSGEPMMSEYAYTSVELRALAHQIAMLKDRITVFRVALFGRWPERQRPLPRPCMAGCCDPVPSHESVQRRPP